VIDGGDWPTATHENSNDANAKKRRIFIGLYNIPSGAAGVACGSFVLCCGPEGLDGKPILTSRKWGNLPVLSPIKMERFAPAANLVC
jgi:hypothetical protein